VTEAPEALRYRWLILAVFVLSNSINYLDRMTLGALWPAIRDEFHLTATDYGWIIAAFSVPYAITAPFAGMLIDRIGLNRAISLTVGVWSCAGIATGFTSGLGGLIGVRSVLGMAEAGGVPSTGKAIHLYLLPRERALGNAVGQIALSFGMAAAPLLAVWITVHYGWRTAFTVTGVLGLLWIPLWNLVARRSPPRPVGIPLDVVRDRRLWIFACASAVGMLGYSLWTQFTTLYLVDVYRLTLRQQALLAWIPPVCGAIGGLAGGWFSGRYIARGIPPIPARFRVCLGSAIVSLATAAVPAAPGPIWACVGISLSFAAVASFSVNMYTMPLDAFGAARAGFAISMLVMSYGVIQIFWPLLGGVIDRSGYVPVILLAAVTPLAACAILWGTRAVR
jgi:MFS transporter, ACS family, hexuronate transporter